MKRLLASVLLAVALVSSAFAAPCTVVGTAGDTKATLSWTAPTTHTDSTPITGTLTYNVYRSTTTGTEVLFISGVAGSPFVDSGLTPGVTYFYQVTALESGNPNESAKTPEGCKSITFSSPSPPSGFSVK